MTKRNKIFTVLGIAALMGAGAFAFSGKAGQVYDRFAKNEPAQEQLFRTVADIPEAADRPASFEGAADAAVPSVVHIRTVMKSRQIADDEMGDDDVFRRFFGAPGGGRSFSAPQQRASGSGVIISDDGFIVTNNHVVQGASEVDVTLANRKNYKAKVIGTDPNTDLALIKIDEKGLPVMPVGNSDDVKLGQWVLAVGYPLNLDVTVTQGIISAKSRNIGINRQSSAPVESFLQTDAAVNPGSSGGALVNTRGELIGINSAIASPTGAYAGYAYAIPSNLMKKVIGDIKQFGSVQRGYLGISMAPENLDADQRKQLGIEGDPNGIYVAGVDPAGAAAAAGIRKGDVITGVNGTTLASGAQLQEQIARLKPGDRVQLTFLRNGSEQKAEAVLKGKMGDVAMGNAASVEALGADFAAVNGGVQVTNIREEGVLADQTNMKKGFVITRVGGIAVRSVEDLKAALARQGSNFQIEGTYPGSNRTYYYGINDFSN